MRFIGVDVAGSKKGQTVAVMDDSLSVIYLEGGLSHRGLVNKLIGDHGKELIVAIDAPRKPVKREDGKWGRECERKLHKQGFRLQWTPPAAYFADQSSNGKNTKEWMEIGFELFEDFCSVLPTCNVIEVFPSCSYNRFPPNLVRLPFNFFQRETKVDQLDAICCALTAWCYETDQFESVGEPGEGFIVMPRCVSS